MIFFVIGLTLIPESNPYIMRKLILLAGIIILFCGVEPVPSESFPYKPILMTREMLESSVAMMPPVELVNTGKIYISNNYIFINEKYKGVHVIDNSDPSNPVKTGFLRIPGCLDIAVKGNVLYADNAVDLIAVDMTNPSGTVVTKRIRNIFPERNPPGYDWIPWNYNTENRPKNTIIVEWTEN